MLYYIPWLHHAIFLAYGASPMKCVLLNLVSLTFLLDFAEIWYFCYFCSTHDLQYPWVAPKHCICSEWRIWHFYTRMFAPFVQFSSKARQPCSCAITSGWMEHVEKTEFCLGLNCIKSRNNRDAKKEWKYVYLVNWMETLMDANNKRY